MSVSSTQNKAGPYTCNGVTTTFAFPYYFMAAVDLLVTITDNAGNVTTQTLDSDYSVSGTPDANGLYSGGGSVVFGSAPTSGKLLIQRLTPDTQASTWSDSDTAKAIGFDKLTLITQRLFDLFSRVPLLPDGFVETFDSSLPKVMTPNAFLAVNADGDGWTLIGSGVAQGTVTSVGLTVPAEFTAGANVTTSGSLSFSKNNQSANRIYAGPSTGSAAAPTFRVLVAADIPQLVLTSLSSSDGTSGQIPVADGSGGISWQDIVGTGTVTSVALSVPSEFSVGGSPITDDGTLSFTKVTQVKNRLWAGPVSGSDAEPTFRELVAADLPLMGAASSGSAGAVGAVPAPGSGKQSYFLRGDATWALPPQGTVTSVDLAVPTDEFSVSGDPITSSGTITIAKKSQAKNTFFAGPSSGSNSAPAFRSIAAVDLPVMVGCTSIASGTKGAVPAPSSGQQEQFLRGDGIWATPSGGGGGGSFTAATVSVTADYSGKSTDNFVTADATSGDIAVTTPDPANGQIFGVNKKDAGANTVSVSGNINGGGTVVLHEQNDSITLWSDGTNWYPFA